MSRCILQEAVILLRVSDWCDVWRVSYCEELVGVLTGDDVVGLGESNIYHKFVDFSIMGDLNWKVVIK